MHMPRLCERFAALFIAISAQASQYPLFSSYAPSIPPESWVGLNKSVEGRLYLGQPVGLPCYNNFNGEPRAVDNDACAIIENNKANATFMAAQMAGYVEGNWGLCHQTGSGCPISTKLDVDPNANCTQGAVPSFFIDVRKLSDAQAGLAFANQHGVSLVVKSSGHDNMGRSSGPVPLALWMANYTPNITVDHIFVPEGCRDSVGDVITFSSGTSFADLYKFADSGGLTVIGACVDTVRPGGGWIAGGGHSPLSPVYGLGVDNVKQIRVVLPDGTYVTANQCQNRALFFALRGGGGGTFGVNMEISLQAHKRTETQAFHFWVPKANMTEFLKVFVANTNRLHKEGWGGYVYANSIPPSLLLNPRLNAAEAQKSLAPLIKLLESVNASMILETHRSYYDVFQKYIQPLQDDTGNWGRSMASRLVPSEQFDEPKNQADLVDALVDAASDRDGYNMSLQILLVAPNASIIDENSSITPIWRKSTWHVMVSKGWDPATANATYVHGAFKAVHRSIDKLRSLTAENAGAYQNQADTFESGAALTFWGRENYEKLKSIKESVDPNDILYVRNGIGFDTKDRFRCYYDRSETTGAEESPSMVNDEL